jgi:hypothetical protein
MLVTIGLVLGIEAAVSGPGRADVGTVAGVLKMTGVTCPSPRGWAGSCSVSFRRYFGPTVFVPCAGTDSEQSCAPPPWAESTPITVPVDSRGRYTASLMPGRYQELGYPCGDTTVVVRSGMSLDVSMSCSVLGTIGHAAPAPTAIVNVEMRACAGSPAHGHVPRTAIYQLNVWQGGRVIDNYNRIAYPWRLQMRLSPATTELQAPGFRSRSLTIKARQSYSVVLIGSSCRGGLPR